MTVAATAEKAPSGLLPVDQLIAGIVAEPERYITQLKAKRDSPHVSIEVLSDLHVDPPADEDAPRTPDAMADRFIERYERLRQPFAETGAGLVICRGAAEGEAVVWEVAASRLSHRGATVCFPALADGGTAEQELAAVFSVSLDPGVEEVGGLRDRTLEEPFAYLVVLAWQGALSRGERGSRAVASRRLLRALTESKAENAPTYIVCVSDGDGATEALARECELLRVSLVLAGVGEDVGLVTSTRAGQERGQPPRSVAVAHCPGFRAGSSTSGMTRVRLDVWKGEAEVAFNRALGSDRPQRAIQVVAPLCSASRVASSERRLRSRVERLIRSARAAAEAETVDLAKLDTFETEVADHWEKDGYVRLCNDAGDVPLPVTRHTSYNLLLLVRERGEGEYDVLLSNHSPLRPSLLSDWNTLLMPAFKDPRALLEHLRDDVLRQASERTEDVERVAHARQFEAAVGRILDDETKGSGDALWADEMREIASRQVRKISPTTGAVTEFDYQLVTLMPLIERPTANAGEEGGDGEAVDTRALADRRRIIEWLDGLAAVATDESPNAARELPFEALKSDGAALRWDPRSGLVEDPGSEDRRKLRSAAPGALWFPLADKQSPWRDCPSIDSRNADVMIWAANTLNAARDGRKLPPELVLGNYAGSGNYEVDDEILPFESEEKQEDPKGHCFSTKEALERVRFAKGSGLSGKNAYEGAEVRPVFLCRDSARVAGVERNVISVYAAQPGEEFGPDVRERGRLGVLRPVQRYVLRAGMERAAEINAMVIPLLAERGDPWGYVRLRKGAASQLVSVTTPIVEQAWREDLDGLSRDGETEFVVCDGNHRIVSGVWESRESDSGWMPAVAVVGELKQPYYARPFGRYEWDATADNVLEVSPGLASKYLTRSVDWDKDLKDEDRKLLANVPKARWYRRYFRDLTTGFGYMGGQGGRW